jgi:hypothetical protein
MTMHTYLVEYFSKREPQTPCGSRSFDTEAAARTAVQDAARRGFCATVYHNGYILDTRPKKAEQTTD